MRSRADPALRRNAYLRTVLLETGLGAQLNARFPVAAYVPSSSNDSSLSSSKTRQAETAEFDPDTLLVLNLPMEGYCALHTSAIFKAVALFSARLKERREAELGIRYVSRIEGLRYFRHVAQGSWKTYLGAAELQGIQVGAYILELGGHRLARKLSLLEFAALLKVCPRPLELTTTVSTRRRDSYREAHGLPTE